MGDKRDELHNRFTEWLRRSGVKPGERLPGERDLAAVFGVGRTVLRALLDDLEAEGALVRRPQSGTMLAALPTPRVSGAPLIALISPFQDTGHPGRRHDPVWLTRVTSAFERTVVAAGGARLLVQDQSPFSADPCSVKDMAHAAADAGAQAAVFIHPTGPREKIAYALAWLHDRDVHPVILSSRTYPGLASQVYFDSVWGAYRATRYLLQRGHRRLGFIGAPTGHEWVRDRLQGFRNALATATEGAEGKTTFTLWEHLSDEDTERLESPADGADAFAHWQALPDATRPTALLAVNDVVAIGFLRAARAAGVSIPEDVSLIGFDNNPDALIEGLTTVERPAEALGQAAGRITLERLAEGHEAATVTHRLRPVIIERATVGLAPLTEFSKGV